MRARLIAVAALACVAAAAQAGPSPTEQNRKVITDFARIFYGEKDVRRAFETYVVPDYIQHNPGVGDGRAAAIAALTPMFSNPAPRFEVKRIIVDGDLAVIHLYGKAGSIGSGGAVTDIYRLSGGKIVEHWDVLQPITPSTVNPHPFF